MAMGNKQQPKVWKENLLKALEKTLGIVTPACEEVGVSRETFYRYYNSDEEFKRKVDEIQEIQIDFVESELFKKIRDGSERSILFYMRYKGKKRGYTDSIDITSEGKSVQEIKLIQIQNREDGEVN